jgi:dimethylamine monooxygenase subunit B
MSSGTIDVFVEEIKRETPRIKSFKLRAANGKTLPRISGGAHVTTIIEKEEGVIERSYSLTNDPNETNHYKIAICKSNESKGGSIYWHENIEEGDRLKISYPKNHFPLSFMAKHHIFIAAGIGITPFLSMAKELKRKSKSFELHYAAPSKDMCAFYPFLNSEYSEYTNFYFSKEKNKMKTDLMKDKPVGTHVYFCGPESMVKEYTEAAKSYGYPEQNIHFELFTPPDFGPKQAFEVELKKSNKVLEIPEGEDLLDVLLANNIDAPYSCKIGGCGSCLIDVKDGEVDHRDVFLTDSERDNKVILTCVSRAKSGRLVLDL